MKPSSRVYRHAGCGGETVVSGDDYLSLEYPFRPVDSTMCSACGKFVPLTEVAWSDTGENIADYRERIWDATPFGDRVYWLLLGTALSYDFLPNLRSTPPTPAETKARKAAKEAAQQRTMYALAGSVSLVVGLLLGAILYGFWQELTQVQEEPQTISLADLVKNGPGDNLRVKITEAQLGKPVREVTKGYHTAWFPVYEKGRAADDNPPVVLMVKDLSTDEAVDGVIKKGRGEGIIFNSLRMGHKPPATLFKAYPKLESSNALYVGDVNVPPPFLRQVAMYGAPAFAVLGLIALVSACRVKVSAA